MSLFYMMLVHTFKTIIKCRKRVNTELIILNPGVYLWKWQQSQAKSDGHCWYSWTYSVGSRISQGSRWNWKLPPATISYVEIPLLFVCYTLSLLLYLLHYKRCHLPLCLWEKRQYISHSCFHSESCLPSNSTYSPCIGLPSWCHCCHPAAVPRYKIPKIPRLAWPLDALQKAAWLGSSGVCLPSRHLHTCDSYSLLCTMEDKKHNHYSGKSTHLYSSSPYIK